MESTDIEPTIDEQNTLTRVSDRIPLLAWLIVICELCERFTFYGVTGPFQNYIQFPLPGPNDTQPGALGRGQQTATSLTIFFHFFSYLTPIIGAIIADQFWGKYKTIVVSCIIYLVGISILVLTSLPFSIKENLALPGLIISMIILGTGAGGVKSNVSPLMADQYTQKNLKIKEENGVKTLIDPQITIQSLFSWFYWAINLGGVSAVLITYVEKYHSFWLAYLIPLIVFHGSILTLLIGRKKYIKHPPSGSILVRAYLVMKMAVTMRWKLGKQDQYKHILDYAKEIESSNENVETKINHNQFIEDLKQAIRTFRMFLFFPFYWVCYNQIVGNLISQAAQMHVGSLPNDVLQVIDPLIIIIFIPIFDKIVYPLLRRRNIMFTPILRITCGFLCASISMAWTAYVQMSIYSTGPNYSFAQKPCPTCQKYNNINVAWQIPSYVFIAISEIFTTVTGLEYAYTHAPATMKSIVMSIFLFTTAIGGMLNFALLPINIDPKLLWMYTSLSIVALLAGISFYITFRNEDKKFYSTENKQRSAQATN